MRKLRSFALPTVAVCMLALLPGRVAVSQVTGKRLAVLEFKGPKIEAEVMDNFSDEVRGGAVAVARGLGVLVMTRESMVVLLKEMGKKECNEGDCEVETAKNIGADFVVSGSVAKIEGTYVVTLKLFETAKATLLATARIEAKRQLEVSRQLRQHGRDLVANNIGARPAPAPAPPTSASALLASSPPVAAAPPAPSPSPVPPPRSAPGCAPNQVAIPGGTFWMGSEDGYSPEKPVHRVTLSPYCIDKTEVTVAAYRACVRSGACRPASATIESKFLPADTNTRALASTLCTWGKAGLDQHPLNCVDWNQAKAYCEGIGARLPTEAEWEFAARGTDGRKYPWGNEPPAAQLCWNGEGSDLGKGRRMQTCSVGRYPAGASPFGVLDMAGSVWEWTEDSFGPYSPEAQRDPHGSRPEAPRVCRGGSWDLDDPSMASASGRLRFDPGDRHYNLGFRCARGANM